MIDAILDIIKPAITNLYWVDRYAGIARAITRERVVVSPDNEYQATIAESFPAGRDIDVKQCWENGLYLDLVPNDKYKSVVYWEDLTGLQEAGQYVRLSGGRSFTGYQATLRMVCWLNVQKLGYDGYEKTTDLLQDAMKAINSVDFKGITSPVRIRRLTMQVMDILPKDHNSIFSRYSYAGDASLFMHPFDFFALNVRTQVQLSSDCVPLLTQKFEIPC